MYSKPFTTVQVNTNKTIHLDDTQNRTATNKTNCIYSQEFMIELETMDTLAIPQPKLQFPSYDSLNFYASFGSIMGLSYWR